MGAQETTKSAKGKSFLRGLKNGLPVGLGYLAVAFSLGIAARNAGLTAFESFAASFLCTASAGEAAAFSVIGAAGSYIEMAIVTFVVNARYLLMSLALSQRMNPKLGIGHRLLIGFNVTDELFGISIANPGETDPYYYYGTVVTSTPLWWLGTVIGCIMGNVLPLSLVSAFSVALYGMFLAVFIPPMRKSKIIAGIVALCFAASWAASVIPGIKDISEGLRIIILTVVISAAAALIFPRKEEAVTAEGVAASAAGNVSAAADEVEANVSSAANAKSGNGGDCS